MSIGVHPGVRRRRKRDPRHDEYNFKDNRFPWSPENPIVRTRDEDVGNLKVTAGQPDKVNECLRMLGLMRNRQESCSFLWKPVAAVMVKNLRVVMAKEGNKKNAFLVHYRVRVCVEVFIISNIIIIRQPPCPRRYGRGSSPRFCSRFTLRGMYSTPFPHTKTCFFLFAFFSPFRFLHTVGVHDVVQPPTMHECTSRAAVPPMFYGKRSRKTMRIKRSTACARA